MHISEFDGVGAQFSADKVIHQVCVAGAVCFGHNFLWDGAIFFDKVDDVFPIAAVWYGFAKEELHLTVKYVTACEFYDVFEEAIDAALVRWLNEGRWPIEDDVAA